MTDIRASKSEMRSRMRSARLALEVREIRTRSASACRAVIEAGEFVSARVIALYRAMPGEVITDDIFEAAMAKGKTALFPRVESGRDDLTFCVVERLGDMVPGKWGILEPAPESRVCPIREADLAIVPGVAFDRRGGRLGQGGGFYDRIFDQMRPGSVSMGIAFDLQIVDEIPREPHDKLIHCLATESGMLRFHKSGGET